MRSSEERAIAEARQIETFEVLRETDRLRSATLQKLWGERSFLLTEDERFLDEFHDGHRKATESYTRLIALTSDNPEQQARLAEMRPAFGRFNAVLDTIVAQQRAGRHETAVLLVRNGEDDEAASAILGQIEALQEAERSLYPERSIVSEMRARTHERHQFLLAGIALLFMVLSIIAVIKLREAFHTETRLNRELQRKASIDGLTDLPNRRSFLIALTRSMSHTDAHPENAISLALINLDQFKAINNRFGQAAGDRLIRVAGERAADVVRKRDLVGRIGGDEFAVILPRTDLEAARAVCERIRDAIAKEPIVHEGAIIPITASIGIAQSASGENVDGLITRANAALHDAKTGGRNQVRLAD